MNVVFVPIEFESVVDTLLETIGAPIRLGGRMVNNGEYAGKLLVNPEIFFSCQEWEALTRNYISGGTAWDGETLTIEAGKTIEITDAFETVWTFEIYNVADITSLFNTPEEF